MNANGTGNKFSSGFGLMLLSWGKRGESEDTHLYYYRKRRHPSLLL